VLAVVAVIAVDAMLAVPALCRMAGGKFARECVRLNPAAREPHVSKSPTQQK
jgi:hypothetical protein